VGYELPDEPVTFEVTEANVEKTVQLELTEAAVQPPPQPDPDPDPDPAPDPGPSLEPDDIERRAGSDRYGTAAEAVLATFDDAETVYLATGEVFADALAVGPVAAGADAPLLLVRSDGPVPTATVEAIEQLGAEELVIAGGAAAVSDRVVEDLAELGDVRRIAGADRIETAAALATSAFDDADEALVATARDFADALAGGALAGQQDVPLLLVEPDRLPAATAQTLATLGVDNVTVLGGASAVDDRVVAALEDEVDGAVERVFGADRFSTAAEVAAVMDEPSTALLATGRDFADALAGVPLAAAADAPVLLTEPDRLPAATRGAIDALPLTSLTVLGGDAAVDPAVIDDIVD